jgi:hypothetical protein
MKITTTATPRFEILMNAKLLGILKHCASMHYDHTCKKAARSVAQGEPINGHLVQWGFFVEDEHSVCCDRRVLGLTAKICEMPPPLPPEDFALLDSFRALIHGVMAEANLLCSCVHKVYEPQKEPQ